jgi:hypothetical protein
MGHGVREEEDWNRRGAEPVGGGGDQGEVERIHGEQPGIGKVSERGGESERRENF